MYINTKYIDAYKILNMLMFINTKYIDVFKYFIKYFQNIDLFNPLTFLI